MSLFGGGYNSYGGGGGGQSSQMMMSSSLSACMSISLLAAGGLWYMNDQAAKKKKEEEEAGSKETVVLTGAVDPATAGAAAVGGLDGDFLVTVGSKSMKIHGSKCGEGRIGFATSQNDKWIWRLAKAGDWNGASYYTLESFYKNFNQSCTKRFLTAPKECKSAPFLADAQYGPQQYWLVLGDATSGYQLRSLACAKNRSAESYLMQSAQAGDKPMFSGRSGSRFEMEKPYTA